MFPLCFHMCPHDIPQVPNAFLKGVPSSTTFGEAHHQINRNNKQVL